MPNPSSLTGVRKPIDNSSDARPENVGDFLRLKKTSETSEGVLETDDVICSFVRRPVKFVSFRGLDDTLIVYGNVDGIILMNMFPPGDCTLSIGVLPLFHTSWPKDQSGRKILNGVLEDRNSSHPQTSNPLMP